MDRVSVVVVVENHKDNALFLGSSISFLSPIPQMSGTHLLVETQKTGFNLRPLTERLTLRAQLSPIPSSGDLLLDRLSHLTPSDGVLVLPVQFSSALRTRVPLEWNICLLPARSHSYRWSVLLNARGTKIHTCKIEGIPADLLVDPFFVLPNPIQPLLPSHSSCSDGPARGCLTSSDMLLPWSLLLSHWPPVLNALRVLLNYTRAD